MADRENYHVTNLQIGDPAISLSGAPFGCTFTIGAEAADVINVAGQLTDAMGKNVSGSRGLQIYLSANDDGSTLEGTSATLSLAIGTDGLLMEEITDGKFTLVTESTGAFDIDVTETVGANTFYLVLIMPTTGALVISSAITFAA